MNFDEERRFAGGLGALSAVLVAASFLLLAGSPFPDASPDKILSWYHAHRTAAEAAAAINGLAAIPFLIFVAHLRARLVRTGDGPSFLVATMFGGALVTVTLSMISALPVVALSLQANRPGPPPPASLVHLLADLDFYQHGNQGLVAAVFIGSLGLLALQRRMEARWVGYVAVLAAAFSVVGGTVAFFPSRVGKPNPVGVLGPIGFLLVEVCVLAVGILMVTRAEDRPTASPRQSAGAPQGATTR